MVMETRDWIAAVQGTVTAVGVLVALYIALRRERIDKLNEALRRTDKMVEIFGPPLALTEIAIGEMEALLAEITAPYYEGGWAPPDELIDRCDKLIDAFDTVVLTAMPTNQSVKLVWSIRKLLREGKRDLIELGKRKSLLVTITSDQISACRSIFEMIKGEADLLVAELMLVTEDSHELKF